MGIKKPPQRQFLFLLLILFNSIIQCDGNNSTESKADCTSNSPPKIADATTTETNFLYDQRGVLTGGTTTVTREVIDPDGDSLKYTWSVGGSCGEIKNSVGPTVTVSRCLSLGKLLPLSLLLLVEDRCNSVSQKIDVN